MPPAGYFGDAEAERSAGVCVQLASPDFKYMTGGNELRWKAVWDSAPDEICETIAIWVKRCYNTVCIQEKRNRKQRIKGERLYGAC